MIFTLIPELPTNLTWIDSCLNRDASVCFSLGLDINSSTVTLYRRKNDIWNIVFPSEIASVNPYAQIICDYTGQYVMYSTSLKIYFSTNFGDNFILSNLPITANTIIGISMGGNENNMNLNIYSTISYNSFNNNNFCIIKSTNFGVNWNIIYKSQYTIYRIASALNNGYIYTMVNNKTNINDFLISTDYGVNFTKQKGNQASPLRILTNDNGNIVVISFTSNGSGIIPKISTDFSETYNDILDENKQIITSITSGPIFLSNTGNEFLCVKSLNPLNSNSQIYNKFVDEDFATKVSDQIYQWTSLSSSNLLQPSGSATFLAGTEINGMFISKT